jgi:peptidoglycan lytic transglycosylase
MTVPRSRGGGYYLDDGPGDSPPADLDTIPEPVPQFEPLHRAAMRPYAVMGQTYTPMTELSPYKARGVASWYGRRYHGKQTSIGEIYNMYGMTAAHPVLPLPSYVRVTHVATGKSVVVRVNDRGPFIDSRLIDLSYTAAYRLGVLAGGSAVVEVEVIIPDGTPPSTAVAVRSSSELAATGFMASKPDAVEDAPKARSAEVDAISSIAAAARDNNLSVNAAASQPSSQPALPLSSKTTPADASGVYLQLAAFGSRNNAESYLARAKLQVEWLAQLLHLFARDGLYRIHAGPYASSYEARQAAERIALTLGAKPLVVTR